MENLQEYNLALTHNGALTLSTSLDSNLDLFSMIGSCRNNIPDALKLFEKAYKEDPKTALRVLLWARDIRGGAGEREIFRKTLEWLIRNDKLAATKLALSGIIPEIGRFDDLIVFLCNESIPKTLRFILAEQLKISMETKSDNSGLIAKWMPRKGLEASKISKLMNLSPKAYRKLLVENTKVVETKMCAKAWDEIEVDKIPSLAFARYISTLTRHVPEKIADFKARAKAGKVSVKTETLYPYDILKTLRLGDVEIANLQWEEYIKEHVLTKNILPVIDVSGSMEVFIGGSSTTRAMDISISLGILVAQCQTGKFKDLALTFHTNPTWAHINQETFDKKVDYVASIPWGGSTNLTAAFNLILKTALENGATQEDMPENILIISDMQFDIATRCNDKTNFEVIEQKYQEAGYTRPNIIFWNVNASSKNIQVRKDEHGTAMISGFSPAILESILKCEDINPIAVMLEAIGKKRYDVESLTV